MLGVKKIVNKGTDVLMDRQMENQTPISHPAKAGVTKMF